MKCSLIVLKIASLFTFNAAFKGVRVSFWTGRLFCHFLQRNKTQHHFLAIGLT